MAVAVICVGVCLVLNHSMSVGGLIAFQMLSHRVSGPIIQWAGLYDQSQDIIVAVIRDPNALVAAHPLIANRAANKMG